MISSKHRFHGRGSLRYVYRSGATTRGPLFAVKSIVNEKRDTYRLAVVISRKVHKSAVARNRMRRRLYAAVRNIDGGIVKPYDIVITVFQPTLLDESSEKLAYQVKQQLTEAGILKHWRIYHWSLNIDHWFNIDHFFIETTAANNDKCCLIN